MSRASIPPMSSTSSNPRLNTSMDALVSKLTKMAFLQPNHFRIYLLQTLTDRWFKDHPRELFTLLMSIEYRWRLALHAPYEKENEVMTASVVGYNEPQPANARSGNVLLEGGPVTYDQYEMEVATAQNFQDGWNEGREKLKEEVLGDEAKKAVKQLLLDHRLRKSAGGLPTCSCMRGVQSPDEWAGHVMLRIMNYLRNEFIRQAGGGQ